MTVFKCKMCGGDLQLTETDKVVECEYCGTTQTVPSADNEKKMTLFNRANKLRFNSEFDKAAGIYESIIADFPEEAEAYWGIVLCKYGIEYVDDPATGKKIPTCHRSSFSSVMEDDAFEQACENADPYARRVYRDEAKRIEERVRYDLEMIQEVGYCSGVENYSRYFDGRKEGQRPFCLLDYFPKDFITFVDESHVTLPQVHAMYGGDHSRKSILIEYGFRLPAAADNRPLKFDEFEALTGQVVYVSATPADYELEKSEGLVVEQVVRPTGLLDPPIEVRPTKNQVDDLVEEIRQRSERDERVLVTTLTKRMAEELDDYLRRIGVRVRYIHSDVDTTERVEIIEDFKGGLFDVLVGVNLLREGLDIPSVSLVAILDADKEGFLRTGRALTQTAGRAARNVNGLVIMYADTITRSMEETIRETNRRRQKQMEYNKVHGITPKQVETKLNVLAAELTPGKDPYGRTGKPVSPRLMNGTTGRVSAANSYDDPTYIPNPSDLGRGMVSVGFGHDSKRADGSAFVDGYVTADLAAVLQDPVIRSMSRDQVEKMVEEDHKQMMPEYDSGDHLHPSLNGANHMAHSIPEEYFR